MNTQTKTKLIHKTKHWNPLKRRNEMKPKRMSKKLIERLKQIENKVDSLFKIVDIEKDKSKICLEQNNSNNSTKSLFITKVLPTNKLAFENVDKMLNFVQFLENKVKFFNENINTSNESITIQPQEIKN